MKKLMMATAALGIFLLPASLGWAQEDLVEKVVEACETEIQNYCSQVTPGEGRILACFYAHEDKLSGRCGYALYDAAAQLEEFAAAVTHVATECHDDLVKFCSQVQMGEGQVASCLLENKDEVTQACRQAMEDTGLHYIEEE
jgi:hypothetical protein